MRFASVPTDGHSVENADVDGALDMDIFKRLRPEKEHFLILGSPTLKTRLGVLLQSTKLSCLVTVTM